MAEMNFWFLLICTFTKAQIVWTSVPTNSVADLRIQGVAGGTVKFCEGGPQKLVHLVIHVKYGIPPWRINVVRNKTVFEKIIVESNNGLRQSTFSGSYILNTTVPGEYSLDQLFDNHSCPGNVSLSKIYIEAHPLPSAFFDQKSSAICLGDTQHDVKLILNGFPPFKAVFTPLGGFARDSGTRILSIQYDSAGPQGIPRFDAAGLRKCML